MDRVTGHVPAVHPFPGQVWNVKLFGPVHPKIDLRITLSGKGRVDHKEGETKLLAQDVRPFEAVPARREVRLRIDATQAAAGLIAELARVIRDFPGESPVLVDCMTSQGQVRYQLGERYRVKPAPDFYAEVRALLGESALA
jgi:hypothetical protein